MRIKDWKSTQSVRLRKLFYHMQDHGADYGDVEDLLVDMLDDVLDVWEKSHKNTVCESH